MKGWPSSNGHHKFSNWIKDSFGGCLHRIKKTKPKQKQKTVTEIGWWGEQGEKKRWSWH